MIILEVLGVIGLMFLIGIVVVLVCTPVSNCIEKRKVKKEKERNEKEKERNEKEKVLHHPV